MGYPDAAMARGDGPVSQAFDPQEMLESAADLVSPVAAARHMPWLASELLKIATGQSGIAFAEGDRRFADVTWQDNPFFHLLGQGYRLFEEWTDRMVDAVDGPWDRQARTRLPGQHRHRDGLAHQLLLHQPGRAQARLRDGRPVGRARRVEHDARSRQGRHAPDGQPGALPRGREARLHPGRRRLPRRDVRVAAVRPHYAGRPQPAAAHGAAGAQPPLRPRPRARAQPGGVRRRERHPDVHDRLAEPPGRARARAVGAGRLHGGAGSGRPRWSRRSPTATPSTGSGCAPAGSPPRSCSGTWPPPASHPARRRSS